MSGGFLLERKSRVTRRAGASSERMERRALAVVLFLLAHGSAVVFNRKILLLPGSCSSAGAFLNMPTGAAPLIGAAKATYHDGGRLAWLFEAIDPQTPSGEWFCPGGTGEGADESIAAVEAALEAGGFAGLVGFDDGAALASLVAARAALGEGCAGRLQFAVMCSSIWPTPYEPLLHRSALHPAPLTVTLTPTLPLPLPLPRDPAAACIAAAVVSARALHRTAPHRRRPAPPPPCTAAALHRRRPAPPPP